MPALLFSAALATEQPSIQTVRLADSAAWARISTVQDLSGVVSGAAPFVRTSTAAQVASIDTGLNSVTLAATAVSARIVVTRP